MPLSNISFYVLRNLRVKFLKQSSIIASVLHNYHTTIDAYKEIHNLLPESMLIDSNGINVYTLALEKEKVITVEAVRKTRKTIKHRRNVRIKVPSNA